MAKSINLVVVVVLATAGIPSHDVCVRAELHHGVWPCGAWEGMPMKTCPNKGINMLSLIQQNGRGRGLLASCPKGYAGRL